MRFNVIWTILNIVILGPTGYSTTGEVFNLLAEEVATKTATRLKADKLIILGRQHGLLDSKGQLKREVTPQQLDDYILSDEQDIEIRLQLKAAQEASRNGVNRVHLISYTYDGALLEELFTRDGSGTMITDAHYEEVRMAEIQDVGGLIRLLRPWKKKAFWFTVRGNVWKMKLASSL